MSKIQIKNFGPIKEGCLENDGWIDISKVTVFTGNQGSGKSTIAKLISTFTWIEKALVRGDYDKKWFEKDNRMKRSFLPYHRLENYILKNRSSFVEPVIKYKGDAYSITYENNRLKINELNENHYLLPQIMYVPAERNFISYVKNLKELKLSSDSLKEFLSEFEKAKINLINDGDKILLPINNVAVAYIPFTQALLILGDDYNVALSDSSSGFQSIVPLFLVSRSLAHSVHDKSRNKDKMSLEEELRFRKKIEEIISNENLTSDQTRVAISVLSSKFNKTAFINIVEEPEQNLYPTSQWNILKSLLEFNNMNDGNKLVMTTHSPYVVNYLSIAIQAGILLGKLDGNKELIEKLYSIVPMESILGLNDVSIYEMNETDGTIKKLPTYEGIPSDRNLLNDSLAQGNDLFDQLLEIEQELES